MWKEMMNLVRPWVFGRGGVSRPEKVPEVTASEHVETAGRGSGLGGGLVPSLICEGRGGYMSKGSQ